MLCQQLAGKFVASPFVHFAIRGLERNGTQDPVRAAPLRTDPALTPSRVCALAGSRSSFDVFVQEELLRSARNPAPGS